MRKRRKGDGVDGDERGTLHPELPGSRDRLVFTRDNCVYCTVYAKKCPTGALIVNWAQKKWAIDRLLCITCGYCVETCPKKSLSLVTAHAGPVVTKDREAF